MIWLLLIPCIVSVVWGILKWGHKGHYDSGEAQGVAVMLGTIVGLIILGICVGCTLSNGASVARLQAFLDANIINYEVTIDDTAVYISEEEFIDKIVSGSLEKLQQAGYVSERIKEKRDAVNTYNKDIASLKYYDGNIFTCSLVPNQIRDMKLIIIK